jgi:hypothetical protein
MISADEIIKELENEAVRIATKDVMDYLVSNVWIGFGWIGLNPLFGFFVGFVAGILMEKLDWVSYMVIDSWETTNEGKAFAKTATELSAALDRGNADEIAAAQRAKEDAFRRLISVGSV